MTFALVPVKRLNAAKSRLVAALGRPATERLALAMLGDVLAALGEVPRITATGVVTPDPAVGEAARRGGARPLLGPDPGLNASLERGAKELLAARLRTDPGAGLEGSLRPGVDRRRQDAPPALLIVLGDVAGVRPEDVEALLTALDEIGGEGVVLAPSADGGTAALLRSPPDAMPSRFGPSSARAHREQAELRALRWRSLDLPSLRIDLDTEEDLRAFLAGPGDGPRTRRLLRELGFGGNG